MKRGEIWAAADSSDNYAGKPRPVMVVQSDAFTTGSVTVCLLTTDDVHDPTGLVRIPVQAENGTGLAQPSFLMVDKLTTIRRSRLGKRIGAVNRSVLSDFSVSAAVFLGLAD